MILSARARRTGRPVLCPGSQDYCPAFTASGFLTGLVPVSGGHVGQTRPWPGAGPGRVRTGLRGRRGSLPVPDPGLSRGRETRRATRWRRPRRTGRGRCRAGRRQRRRTAARRCQPACSASTDSRATTAASASSSKSGRNKPERIAITTRLRQSGTGTREAIQEHARIPCGQPRAAAGRWTMPTRADQPVQRATDGARQTGICVQADLAHGTVFKHSRPVTDLPIAASSSVPRADGRRTGTVSVSVIPARPGTACIRRPL